MATHHPNRWHVHTPLTGALAAGTAVANGVDSSAAVNLAGAARVRIRFKASAAGTLRLRPYRVQKAGDISAQSLYDTDLATAVAVSANTETFLDVPEHYGEHKALVVFSPTGNGTVTWADICGT